MKLKRYVQLESGMVYDITKNEFGVDTDYLCLYFWEKNMAGFLGRRAKVGMECNGTFNRWNKITATADDIFDFNGYGWFAYFEKDGWEWMGFVVDLQDEHSGIPGGSICFTTYDGRDVSAPRDCIKALGVPITENSRVVRYELVWERNKQ